MVRGDRMDTVINFSFGPRVRPEQQEATLRTIQRWPSVRQAAQLRPQSNNPAVQKMAFARLADGADAMSILRKIQSLPAVEQASVPSVRRLITSAGT